jgi:hypothetical protein
MQAHRSSVWRCGAGRGPSILQVSEWSANPKGTALRRCNDPPLCPQHDTSQNLDHGTGNHQGNATAGLRILRRVTTDFPGVHLG